MQHLHSWLGNKIIECIVLFTPEFSNCIYNLQEDGSWYQLFHYSHHSLYFFFPTTCGYLRTKFGESNGTPLQYSCLENPMDRGAWWAAVQGSLRVGHDWATSLSLFTFMHWRRKWQPIPVFLPGEFQGQGSLVGCRLSDRTELDTTEAT